ncbi:MAG: CdvA-like protein [Desulfurococcaceae archaeon]
MSVAVDKVEKYLGQPIKDPYGRVIGTLISFYSDSDGNVTELEVCFNDSTFKKLSIDMFKLTSEAVLLLPAWRYNAETVCRRLEKLKKRMHAIEDLYSKKEVPRHAYEVFKKKIDEELSKVKEDARKVKEEMNRRLADLEDEMVELERAFTAVKISYIAGEVSEKAYKAAADQIRKYMEIVSEEKNEVKKYVERIDRLESEPVVPPIKTPEPAQSTQQPVPVVVVSA